MPLPGAIAPIFIRRRDNLPCRAWSWANQLLTALAGHSDARGFRQWKAVGRSVTKGQKSFSILAPMTRNVVRENAETGAEERTSYVFGFKSVAVFGLAQTEGEPIPDGDTEADRWIESLPLLDGHP